MNTPTPVARTRTAALAGKAAPGAKMTTLEPAEAPETALEPTAALRTVAAPKT